MVGAVGKNWDVVEAYDFCIAVDLDPVNDCMMFPSAFSAVGFRATRKCAMP